MRASCCSLLVVGAALLASLLGAAPAAAQFSPGELHEAHADLDDDCARCHARGEAVVAAKCLGCHDALEARIRARAGLHGASYQGKPCENCHIEHLGRKSRLIRWPGGDMRKLDHADAGWELGGSHAPLACLECHTDKTSGGRTTFLGQTTACESCHEDPHPRRLGATCTGCHTDTTWDEVDLDRFDHGLARYPLAGRHRAVACASCHGTPAKYRGLAFASCRDCHADPHEGRFAAQGKPCESCHSVETAWDAIEQRIRKNHPGLSLKNGHDRLACERCHDRGNDRAPSKGDRCASCHREVHEAPFGKACESCHASIRWLGLPEEIGRRAHASTAYPLEGKHAAVGCARCHDAKQPAAKRYRELTYDRCVGCHADLHAGEFAARDGGECGACHTTAGFTPTTFGAAAHATTAFPVDGQHLAAPCSSCHPVAARPRLELRQPKQACADCHDDPHGGQFAAEMAEAGCARCHSTAGWSAPRIDHSGWPLTGAHAAAACARCHGEVSTSPEAGSAAFRGIPRDCEGCHEDLHGGQFRLSEPRRACTSCHDTETFRIAAFDHAAQTDYPLAGKHAAVRCAGCHPQEELRNGAGAVRYRLGYRRCRDCHASPHREVK
jgi:hypothetical protein